MKYKLIFLDTETTGGDTKDRLCQLSYKTPEDSYEDMFDELYLPPLPLSIESMAVHHITQEMVNDKPAFAKSDDYTPVKELLQSEQSVIVAHNAPFDVAMLEKEHIKPVNSIDTLRLVRHFDPEMNIPRHNLQYLRYLLKLDQDIDKEKYPIQAHDAKSDVIILEKLFDRLYIKANEKYKLKDDPEKIIAKMIDLSDEPTIIGKFTFGKHRGKMVKDVAIDDRGYLEWLLGQKKQSSDQKNEEDWIYTLEHFLKK